MEWRLRTILIDYGRFRLYLEIIMTALYCWRRSEFVRIVIVKRTIFELNAVYQRYRHFGYASLSRYSRNSTADGKLEDDDLRQHYIKRHLLHIGEHVGISNHLWRPL